MYHQFNNFTGRISQAVNIQRPLYPVEPLPVSKLLPPKEIQYDSNVKLSTVSPTSKPQGRWLPPTEYLPVSEKIKQKRIMFQNTAQPMYLRGGTPDKMLFGFTIALTAVGVAYAIRNLWRMAHKS